MKEIEDVLTLHGQLNLKTFELKQLEKMRDIRKCIADSEYECIPMLFEVEPFIIHCVFGIGSDDLEAMVQLIRTIEHSLGDDGEVCLTRELDKAHNERRQRWKDTNSLLYEKSSDFYHYTVEDIHDYKQKPLEDEEICDILQWHNAPYIYMDANRHKVDECGYKTPEYREYRRLENECKYNMERLYLSKLWKESDDE